MKYAPKRKIAPKRKVYKKPAYKAVKKFGTPKSNVQMGLGFPMKLTVKQKYCDSHILTFPAVGTVQSYHYALNGLWRPNLSGTSHQPYYFDQYMQLYNHYCVIACKMTVVFCTYETNAVASNVVLYQNDDTTAMTNMTTLQELSRGKKALLNTDGGSTKTLVLNWSARNTFGGSVLGNEELKGDVLANPTELSVGTIAFASADMVTATSVIAQVTMEYITVYFELKDTAGS